MNIALCTDENFVIPCLTCITSILENNKDEECHVYVLTEGLTDNSIDKFHKLSTIYSQPIEIRTIRIDKLKNLKVRPPFPVSMYFRFLLPGILNGEEKVLYLDCDIIVRHSIVDMYNVDLIDKACAVVIDQHCDDVLMQNNVRIRSSYFNSGVMVMNLDYWRKNNVANNLINYIYNNPERCIYPDQDALNIVLDSKVEYLNPTYNFQHYWAVSFHLSKTSYLRHKEIIEASKDPVIVHFCSQKPWHIKFYNPYKSEFYRYNKLHSFVGNAMRNKIIRTVLYKFFNRLNLISEDLALKFNR